MIEGGDRVSAASDGNEFAGFGALGSVLGSSDSGCVERFDFEGAERAVPDQRFSAGNPALDGFDRFRADIFMVTISGNLFAHVPFKVQTPK